MLRFNRKQQNSVKQLSFNKNKLIFKKKTEPESQIQKNLWLPGEGGMINSEIGIYILGLQTDGHDLAIEQQQLILHTEQITNENLVNSTENSV